MGAAHLHIVLLENESAFSIAISVAPVGHCIIIGGSVRATAMGHPGLGSKPQKRSIKGYEPHKKRGAVVGKETTGTTLRDSAHPNS